MAEPNVIYDAAIIGGGLGGLTLAIQLAKQSRKVILFEKEKYPFHKVCGEYISNESWEYLISCGIPLDKMDLPKISKVGITASNGFYLSHNLDLGGFGISRFTLDNLLAEEAKKLGVEIYESCKVSQVHFSTNLFEIQSSIGITKSYYAFGSFGKKSNLDIQLNRSFSKIKKRGVSNYIAVKYHIKKTFDSELIELHNFKDGYCGISQIDEDKLCLCYLTTEQNLKKHHHNIKEMEAEVLGKNPYLKRIFSESTFLYEQALTISQIRFEPKSQLENHLVLLGDAAGLIAPLCGNGMSMAMRASSIIAKILPKDLENEKDRLIFEKEYQKIWNENFILRLSIGRIFQRLFGSDRITFWVLKLLKQFPTLLSKLIGLTHGKKF